jgi:hypothetical protein
MNLNYVTEISETPSEFKLITGRGGFLLSSGSQNCQGNCGLQHCET